MVLRQVLAAGAALAALAGCAHQAGERPEQTASAASAPAAAPPAATPPAAAGATTSLAAPADAPPPKPQPPGPYAVTVLAEPALMTHTVYRPADLAALKGEKLPIVAWGNGACSNAGLLFQVYLRQVASHGYLVIASGPKDAPMPAFRSGAGDGLEEPDPGSGIQSAQTKDEDLLKAVDWAIMENARTDSPLYGKVDTDKVAVMGQSCGGLQATWAAADPRVDTAIIWNSGTFSPGASSPALSLSKANKDSLAKFHTPVAYFPGGPADLAYGNSVDDFNRVTTVPVFFGSLNVGHGGTFHQEGGGWFGEVGVAWLDWRLKGSAEAAKYFAGADCRLCTNPVWEVRKKNMEQGR